MLENKSFVFRFGNIEVREREFCVVKSGEEVSVEPKAFRVLLILLRNPKNVIPKDELLQAVWGDTAVTENSLARAITLLRRILEDDARNPRFIETITSVGYRWLCPFERELDATGVSGDTNLAVAQGQTDTTSVPAPALASAGVLPNVANQPKWAWVSAAGLASLALLIGSYSPLSTPRITGYTQITHDGRSKQLAGTDGNRLYFTQYSPNTIAQVGVNGGEIAELPIAIPGARGLLMDVSPDGSNALVHAYEGPGINGLWVVPMLGGGPRRLEDRGFGASFSRDGGSVIYSTLNGDIFTVRTDGEGKHKLASEGSVSFGFRWSPDGEFIRFIKDAGVWEMSKDGARSHPLLPRWKQDIPQCCGHGRWTTDGTVFVFPSGGQIWALDERRSPFRRESSVPIQLTSGPLNWDQPVPGKDGKTIFAVGATRRGELSRIDVKTGSLTPFLGGISAEFLSFSPDGNYVAYVAFPEGTLWKANRDGSNRMQLTQAPDHVVNPRWSPDSKEIVFTTNNPDGHPSIRRISAVNGASLWLMSEESADMTDADWSSNGRKVLFSRSAAGPLTKESPDLRIVDLDTRQVTVVPGSDGMWSPRWSPDGRYVVAMMGGTESLTLLDFATQRWRTLPANGQTAFPAFSSDSHFVYFLRFGRDQGVCRIPVAGGREERVVNMSDWHLTGHFGASMSLDPTGAPLVLRDVGSDDIYALTLERVRN